MARAHSARVLVVGAVLALLLTPASPGAAGSSTATTSPAFPTAHASVGSAPTTSPATNGQQGLSLTRVSPVVAATGEPVTISGVLDVAALGLDLSAAAPTQPVPPDPGEPATTPPPPEPVATVEVRLGPGTPTSRADVAEWVSGTQTAPGRVLGTVQVVTAPDATVDRIPFAVVVEDVGDRARTPYGVVPVSVDVRLPAAAEPAAVVRTFLGFQARKEYVPLRLAIVVPFTVPADPALIGEFGAARTEAWEELLGEGGTLRERLGSAVQPQVGWALDPALLGPGPAPEEEDEDPDPAATTQPTGAAATSTAATGTPNATPSAGSTTPATPSAGPGTGTTAPGTPTTSRPTEPTATPTDEPPTTLERRLREEFAALLLEAADGRDVLLLPTHDADVAALPAAGAQGPPADGIRSLITRSLDVDDAQSRLTDAGARVTPTVWPVAGGWSTALDAALAGLPGGSDRPWNVLTSTTSLSAGGPLPFGSATGGLVLPYDEPLSAHASAAADRDQAVTAALAMMADSLVVLDERPGTVRHLTVAIERESGAVALSDELTSVLTGVPWLELTGDAGTAATSATPDGGGLVEAAPAAPVPTLLADERARELAGTLERLPAAASVRADTGPELATRGDDTLTALSSARWRGHEEGWRDAYTPIGEDVAATFAGLTIPSRDISFLADSGLLRVAVENGLDTGIENATLDLTVEHPILRVESGPQPVEVGAGSRTTVGFQATAIASGRVSVTATLRAPDGTVLGEPTEFSVRVSPTSDWIYWVIGALAGVVLAIGVARTVLRRRPGG